MTEPSLFDQPERDTLAEARAELREAVKGKGAKCPCCDQFAKIYQRPIGSASARALVLMYLAGGHLAPVHLPTVLSAARSNGGPRSSGGDEAKMVYWGLIIDAGTVREDGGRAGWWRLTDAGVDWVRERSTVPKYAHIYDGRLLKLDGEPWSIRQALGTKFDLRDLMEGTE